MALSHVTGVLAVNDAKISKVTADPAGGTTTYATAIDIPGIKSVGISGDVDTKELRGDNSLLDTFSVLKNIKLAFAWAKLSFDALPVLVGGATTDAGTTPNQTATYDLLGTDTTMGNYWKFEARSAGADTIGGDVHFILWKCKLSAFPPMGLAEEDFQTFDTEAYAVPRLSDGKHLRAVANETLAAIS